MIGHAIKVCSLLKSRMNFIRYSCTYFAMTNYSGLEIKTDVNVL